MPAFGDGYRYHVTGLMHDTHGFPTTRSDETQALMERLHRKIRQDFRDIQITEAFMMDDADVAVVAYGSVSRSGRRAVLDARTAGIRAGLLQLKTLFPFPRKDVEEILKKCRGVVVPEMNMGQISREVKRVNNGYSLVKSYNRVDGQFITPGEILEQLKGF
jgi:2-oxoglutarate ferredoxin oxidoreductase subunit alpha